MNRTNGIIIILAAALTLLGGCAILNLNMDKEKEPATATSPENDTRSIPQLRTENQDLRVKMAKLETYHNNWQTAISSRQIQKKDLERECDRVKKERDYYKKLAKNKND